MLRRLGRRGAWSASARQRGVGLVEVLVAVLILGVGVLGYAGMQIFALQSAEEASYRTHATLIARDALERLLLNAEPDALMIYFDSAQWPSSPDATVAYPMACGTADCNAAQLARADIAQLAWGAARSLPGGMISAMDDCGGIPSPSCVAVTWKEMTPQDCVSDYPNIPNARDYHCVVLEALRP